MNNPLGVSPSKGKQGTTRGKEKNLLTSVGIEPTTSGLDLPLLCRLSGLVAQSADSLFPLFKLNVAQNNVPLPTLQEGGNWYHDPKSGEVLQ